MIFRLGGQVKGLKLLAPNFNCTSGNKAISSWNKAWPDQPRTEMEDDYIVQNQWVLERSSTVATGAKLYSSRSHANNPTVKE